MMSFHQLIWVTLKGVLNGFPPKVTEKEWVPKATPQGSR